MSHYGLYNKGDIVWDDDPKPNGTIDGFVLEQEPENGDHLNIGG